jgi:ABC-2 type transport system permease protein
VSLRPYFAYFTKALKAHTAYGGALLMYLLASATAFSVTVLVWRYATGGPAQAPQLFGYLALAFCVNYAMGSGLEKAIGERIREGYVATDLLKPVDFSFLYLAQSLSDYLFQGLVAAAALAVAVWALGPTLAPASAASAGLALLSLVLAGLVQFHLCFLMVQGVFVTTTNYGVFMTRMALHQALSGVFAPLAYYPGGLQALARALPFHHIVSTPCAIWLGLIPLEEAPTALLHQGLWVLGLAAAGRFVFGRLLRHLTVQGG